VKVLFDIGHPAHVHLFRNAINCLKKRGYQVEVTARDKDIAIELLKNYNINYKRIGKNKKGILKKALNMIIIDYKLLLIAKKFEPNLIVSAGSPYAAHVSKILKVPSIAFVDTEHANLTAKITYPFTYIICTPSCYKKDHGKKQVRYEGYHELAYLHPNKFTPDPKVLIKLGLNEKEKIIIVRLVSWEASHDIKDKGFERSQDIIKILEHYGKVIITSEKKLPEELRPYKMNVPPEDMHHLLNYASLYIGESATMASESAALGTPAIFVSTSTRSYTDELEEKYGLVYNFSDPIDGQKKALDKAIEILSSESLEKEIKIRREVMLAEKIDVTEYMINLIEGYLEI